MNADEDQNSGYICYTQTAFNFVGQACASIFASEIVTTVTDGEALTVELATLHPSNEAVNGYGVSIRYNDKDFSTSSPIITTTSTSTDSQISSTTATTTSSAPIKTSESGSPNISTGAKAGIGIAIAAVAVFFLFAIGYFIMEKRRKNSTRGLSDYSVRDANGKTVVPEFYTVPVEMDGSPDRVVEAEGSPGWR